MKIGLCLYWGQATLLLKEKGIPAEQELGLNSAAFFNC